jgi:CRISPR-associated exonuclease Cas4
VGAIGDLRYAIRHLPFAIREVFVELPDYLPISMLNAFEYCPRRFWIEFVNGEMEINAHVLEGQLRHERAHTPSVAHAGDDTTLRRLYVYSDRLRVAGFADLVEVEQGQVVPVEYKKGTLGKWLNDHLQLCAQAMCLEERIAVTRGRLLPDLTLPLAPIEYGYLFYFGSRRRERVEFDETLRAKTMTSVQQMWELLRQEQMPAPIERYAKCRDCSLEPICLPREVRALGHLVKE